MIASLKSVKHLEQPVEKPIANPIGQRHIGRPLGASASHEVVALREFDHLRNHIDRVGIVGIHDHHKFACRRCYPGTDGRSFATIYSVGKNATRISTSNRRRVVS